MKHATVRMLSAIKTGEAVGADWQPACGVSLDEIRQPGMPAAPLFVERSRVAGRFGDIIEVPTCPRCAVLWDEAVATR